MNVEVQALAKPVPHLIVAKHANDPGDYVTGARLANEAMARYNKCVKG